MIKSLLLVGLPSAKSDHRESRPIISGAKDRHQIPLGYGVRHAVCFAVGSQQNVDTITESGQSIAHIRLHDAYLCGM